MLLALFAGVFRYIDQHFHTPETFVENSASLRDNADVRERIFDGLRTEIIRIAEGDLTDAAIDDAETSTSLGASPEADVVDPDSPDPVTDALTARDQAIEKILLDVLDSDLYDDVFNDALLVTQAQIIRSAELADTDLLRDNGTVSFDLRRLYPTIYQRLAADENTAVIAQTELPADFGIITIGDRNTTIDPIWSAIRTAPGWRTLTYAGAIVSLIGAVVVAERRPSTAIQFGGGMAGAAAVVLVVIYIIRAVVPLLAGGGADSAPVVAVYATTVWPLVRMMLWVLTLGAVLAFGGWIARLIWPDDWVYSHVSDDRGISSIMRRRGAPEPAPQQVAAAAPVHYPGGYAQAPYMPYNPAWGQPYPGQPYGPPGAYPYPVGPYAQPAMPNPGITPGRPTVPVMPVGIEHENTEAVATVAAQSPDPDELPEDAAQVVPKVVASENGVEAPSSATTESEPESADDWSAEPDW